MKYVLIGIVVMLTRSMVGQARGVNVVEKTISGLKRIEMISIDQLMITVDLMKSKI